MKPGIRNLVWLVSAGVLLLGIAVLVVSRTVFWRTPLEVGRASSS